MKYIRTKDGVYSLGDKETDAAVLTNHGWVFKRDIIAQAETVEELEALVDEFVLGKTTCHKPCVTKLPLDFLKECVATKTSYDLVVYGSIWVNDELRKVAKMNDKGEFELL